MEEGFETAAIPAALAGDVGYLLPRAVARARAIMSGELPEGIYPPHFAILGMLTERDAISQQDLATRLGINRTVMVKLIDRLEGLGFVARVRNPDDRRSYMLTVTPAGRRAGKELGSGVERGEAKLNAPLRAGERRRLNDLLHRVLPDLYERLPHPPGQRTGYLLVHTDLRLRRVAEQELAPLGIQLRHFGTLATVDELGPGTQQRLAQYLKMTEPAMVQIVDELEKQGLVERRRDPDDRRRYAIGLTEAGSAKLVDARAAMARVNAKVVGVLGEDGVAELRSLVTKLL